MPVSDRLLLLQTCLSLGGGGGSVAVAGEARLSCSVVIVYRLLLSMTSVTHALI